MPTTPSYQVTGQLDFAEHRVQLRDFSARIGSSDLEGTIAINADNEPPEMTADLHSRSVDLADLGSFISTAPGRRTPRVKHRRSARRWRGRKAARG